jgi:hypothetical protein
MIQRVKTLYQTHYNFLLLVILAIYFRLMTLLLFQPGGFISEWSMYHHFLGIAHVTDYGLYPFIDYWLEYPPLFPWLFTALYRLSLAIPPWWHEQLWFTVLLGFALLPFEIGNLVLVYLIALELYGQDTALKCGWFYASLFVPVYTFVGFFDCLPLFFILLTLWLLLRQRAFWAGITLGVGFMVKVLPAIILPVGLRTLPGLSRKVRYLVISGIVVGLLSLPFLWLNADLFFTSFRSALGRSSWETLWAVLEGYYDFGVIGGDRMDPLVTDFSVHPSTLPWLWISLAFALVGLWIYTWPLESENKSKVVLLAALTLNLFTLYSKGYSPQFLVYILPFVVILLPNLRGVVYCLLLSLVNFIEYPVYFVLLFGESWVLVLVVVFRALLLLALCLEYGFLFFPRSATKTGELWRRVSALSMIVLLLGGCLVSYRMAQAYYNNRYVQEEYRAAIGFLRTQVPPPPRPFPKAGGGSSDVEAALVFTEQPLYYRFYPFLRKDLSVYVVKEADDRLAEIAVKHDEIWLLSGPEANSSVEAWLDDRRHRLANYRFGDDWLFRYSAQRDETAALWIAELDGKVRLLSYQLDTSRMKAGGEVSLTLYWQALREMDESYIVFTQLLDEANQIWGQKDNPPASGRSLTSEWREGEVVEDSYVIPVQADAPQGTYRLIVGMYDPQTMQRLPVSGKEGQAQGDSVLLEERIPINR